MVSALGSSRGIMFSVGGGKRGKEKKKRREEKKEKERKIIANLLNSHQSTRIYLPELRIRFSSKLSTNSILSCLLMLYGERTLPYPFCIFLRILV